MSQFIDRISLIKGNLAESNALRNGSGVYVRVLSEGSAPGKFLVSFAGNKFEVSSQIPLEAGQEFKATINIQNSTIQLVSEFSEIKKLKIKDIDGEESFQKMLQNLGLESDTVNFKLVQFMQQNSSKLLPALIKRANAAGKQIKRKNAKISQMNASEADLSLLLKNIDDNDENILSLLGYFGSFQDNKSSQNNEQNKECDNNSKTEDNKGTECLERIFGSINALNRDFGALTAFNHIRIDASKPHWIVIPFNMNECAGTIRICLDTEKRTAEKTFIHYEGKHHTYHFEIYSDRKKIKFFIKNEEKKSSKFNFQSIINMMKSSFPDFQIEKSENPADFGFLTEDSDITIVSELA